MSFTYLVSTMRNHRHSLLRNCDMLDMSKMFRSRLLNSRQQQETVAVLRKNRMLLDIQPFMFWSPLLVRLLRCKFTSNVSANVATS